MKPKYKYVLIATRDGRGDSVLDLEPRLCKTLKRARKLRNKFNEEEGGGNYWQIYKLVDFLQE